jgi:hypothetical protein
MLIHKFGKYESCLTMSKIRHHLNVLVKYCLYYIGWFKQNVSSIGIFHPWMFCHVNITFICVTKIYCQRGKHILFRCHKYSCYVIKIHQKNYFVLTIIILTFSLLMHSLGSCVDKICSNLCDPCFESCFAPITFHVMAVPKGT